MRADTAKALARSLMDEHGLQDWDFDLDSAVRRAGQCVYLPYGGRITLSRYFVEHNDEVLIRNTILHEIAHALAGPQAGHGPKWKRQAVAIGCEPKACYDSDVVQMPQPPWIGECLSCPVTIRRYRRRRGLMCGRCRVPIVWRHA